MKYTIIDIDNCISDDEWRLMFIDKTTDDLAERYHRYHAKAVHDHPDNLSIVGRATNPVFVTSRPRYWWASTRWWLSEVLASFFADIDTQNRIKIGPIHMRPDGDFRSSPEFKVEVARFIGVDKIKGAYDDRADVVEAYRELGIEAHRLFINARTNNE